MQFEHKYRNVLYLPVLPLSLDIILHIILKLLLVSYSLSILINLLLLSNVFWLLNNLKLIFNLKNFGMPKNETSTIQIPWMESFNTLYILTLSIQIAHKSKIKSLIFKDEQWCFNHEFFIVVKALETQNLIYLIFQ